MSQKTKSAKKTRWHIRTNNLVKIPPYAVAFQDAYGDCEDVAWFHSSDSAAAFIAWREAGQPRPPCCQCYKPSRPNPARSIPHPAVNEDTNQERGDLARR